jgi:MFS family permease
MTPLNLIIPTGIAPEIKSLFLARALRALCDGYVAILLPAYLLALGLGTLEVGLISTATLLGSATLTLTVGAWGYRFHHRVLLLAAATLMMLTGFGMAGLSSFWPLLLVAFVGTINPSSGDVSVFLPLEHARIAEAAQGDARTKIFARYSLIGALFAAVGALAAGLPDVMVSQGMDNLMALRMMFVIYGCTGIIVWWLYQRIPEPPPHELLPHEQQAPPQPLGESRKTVFKLAALFSVDAFAGGFIVNTLLSLWLFQKFDFSLASAGHFFFWAGLVTAFSQLAAPWVAKRIGLLNTMVFTHIPASILLIIAAFTPSLFWVLFLLLVRALLSQMDVPTRSAFVMAVVTPPERAAAASFTSVPRSLASAISPSIGGALFAVGYLAMPLVLCGVLKIAYDLAIWKAFRAHEKAGKI